MLISEFSKGVDELLRDIENLYKMRFGGFMDENGYERELALLQEYFNDIQPVITKDSAGNSLTDEDGKKLYSSADLLELDRNEHIHEIAKQKLMILEKLAPFDLDMQSIDDLQKAYSNLHAKEAFFTGSGENLSKQLDSIQPESESVAYVYGPLNKNVYTEQYEELVKFMVSGQKFKLEVNPQTQEHIVKMNGQEYNLSDILKYANLTHLKFSQKDCDNYLTMLATQPMAYKPDVDQSDAAGLAVARGKINANKDLTNEEKKRQINGLIDGILLKNIEIQNSSKIEAQRDNSLAEISPAERLAINIWTTGFFDCANPFLRGDIESAFSRNRAISDLVGDYKLRLMNELPASGPEAGNLYLSKNNDGQLIYTVLTPANMLQQNQVLAIKGVDFPPGDLKIEDISKYKDKIISETSKRGHTAVKENGRENALRELLCTTAFVVHGASHISAENPLAQQTLYRGDDDLYKPVLDQRLKAAETQDMVSLNAITSTAMEAPNVDFAFNAKPENADKVKVGSIHTAIGKDISAISAFKREKEFLSVSRHKQYEAAVKTGKNEYLFKVNDVTALNQLSPEELLTKNELTEINKREKELNKKEKGLLPSISKSKRKEIELKKAENAAKKAELIEDKKVFLTKIASLKKNNQDDQAPSEPIATTQQNAQVAPETVSRKRKRSDSIDDKVKSAEKYLVKKIKQIKDMIVPPTTQSMNDTAQAASSSSQTTAIPVQVQTNQEAAPSNPLMLPTAQLKHLSDLENELNHQPTLSNGIGGIEHLLIRQFQVDTNEATKAKAKATSAEVKENTAADNNVDPHQKFR